MDFGDGLFSTGRADGNGAGAFGSAIIGADRVMSVAMDEIVGVNGALLADSVPGNGSTAVVAEMTGIAAGSGRIVGEVLPTMLPTEPGGGRTGSLRTSSEWSGRSLRSARRAKLFSSDFIS